MTGDPRAEPSTAAETREAASGPAPRQAAPDAEAPAIDAWIALMRAQRRALGRVEGALKAAGLPPLAWYDVLLELRRKPDGLRPSALEAALLLEQYNVSRLIDRLTAAALVARRPDPEDGRARLLSLTQAGEAMQEAMWPVYRDAVEAAFGAPLSPADARALTSLLGRVAPPA